jgi:serine/threonine protein kinase
MPLSESMGEILERFDEAWNGPTPPRIEDFLPPPDSPAHLPMLAELVKIELERRCRRGEQPSLEEYRQHFPACADSVAAWLDEARASAQRAGFPNKETVDSSILPTSDGPSIPPPHALPLRLLGEYEVLERLGSGGMGEVYKARHRRLGKLVALKLLPADAPHPREMAERFQREMKAVGALDHPNVVEAHDAGEQSGVVYLAMKLIEGIDLDRLVKERGPLPVTQACELVRQAALGLHYLHQRGLVHRDVKPSNLMRTPDGTVKVLDLGLARWCFEAERGVELTETGRAIGTADFLAPEQVENAANAEAPADLYGLGGTLFFLLTGRAPFAHHQSLWGKLNAHRNEIPPDVRTLRPDVLPELAALVSRLLAKQPQKRYRTAAEVASALEPFAKNYGTEAVPTAEYNPPPPPPAPTDKKRNRRGDRKSAVLGLRIGRWSCTLTLTLGLAAVVLAGLPVWWWFGQPAHLEHDIPSALKRAPIHVISLDVNLTRNVNGRGRPAGLLGKKVFDPHLGDTVTVQARLTGPAYAFLIAFRPDGVTEVCFPEKDDQRPELTEKPSYPFPFSKGEAYGLTDGTGLAAFAVVVSSTPLPSFKEWWSHSEGCPWKQVKAPPGVVYRANGEDEVEALDVDGSRGKGATVKGKTPIAQLASWLRHIPQIETVQVLGFAVAAKEDR